ncbi:hypothetical protein BC332_28615 [Capsicum chinense]|nr:hypothetical protein BC332_28615 [Capsicum chinense]
MVSKSSFSAYLLVRPANDVGSFSNSVAKQQGMQRIFRLRRYNGCIKFVATPGYESFCEPAESKGETISEVQSNFVQHKGYRGPALHMKEFNRKIEGNFVSVWLHNIPWGGQDALVAPDAKSFTCIVQRDGVRKLIKELDYVQKIFCGSEDFKGKELHAMTYGLHNKLEKKKISLLDACDFIFHFLKYMDGLSLFLSSSFLASITFFAKSSFNIMGSSNGRKGMITIDHHQDDAKDLSEFDKMIGDECSAIKERSVPQRKENI